MALHERCCLVISNFLVVHKPNSCLLNFNIFHKLSGNQYTSLLLKLIKKICVSQKVYYFKILIGNL